MSEQMFNNSMPDKKNAAPEIKRVRVDKLREGDPKNKDSVKELATTEGEFRQQMIDEGFANSTSINRLADRFSDETLEKLEEKKKARTDLMTGLRNKNAYLEELPQLLSIEKRLDKNCAILMIDFDHFKQVNTEFGHSGGDEALQKMATLIKDHVRSSDLVYRYGGEEFVVFLPDSNSSGASILAENIRKVAEENSMQITGEDGQEKNMTVTVSIGVISTDQLVDWNKHTRSDTKELLKKLTDLADVAAYNSKDAGRNKVTLWTEGMQGKTRNEKEKQTDEPASID